MGKLFNLVIYAGAMLTATTNVFALTLTTPDQKTSFFEQGLPLVDSADGKYKVASVPYSGQYVPSYAAPAGAHVDDGLGMHVNGSFLLWCFSQDGMSIAYTPPTDTVGGVVINQSFKYKPGFKVGFGYDTYLDNWSVNADYTWFHARSGTDFAAPNLETTDFFKRSFFDFSLAASHVHSKWQVHLDQLDLTAGRPFYQGTNVTVAPVGGVRGLLLRQKMNIALTGGAEDVLSKSTSRSWAIGPKGGVHSKLLFGKGFRLESVLGTSVLYTRYTTLSTTEKNSKGTVTSANNKIGTVRPTLDLGLGLGLASYTLNNKLFFDVSARYDFAQYWSQNMIRNFTAQLGGYADVYGDMALHGFTLTARCDF